MKIAILSGAMHGFDHGLNSVVKIIKETLSELGVESSEINLSMSQLHFYDGIASKTIENITAEIKAADGLVIASTAQLFAPCAVMQTFLEYLEADEYRSVLQNKNCLVVSVSRTAGEKDALDYICKVVNFLGGFDCVRIALGGKTRKLLGTEASAKEIIEKQTEDFYRAVRQGRKYFLPDTTAELANAVPSDPFTKDEYDTILNIEKKPKVKAEDLYTKVSGEHFTARQEQDINEIAKLFASKYVEQGPPKEEFTPPPLSFSPTIQKPVVPRVKSCRQMTQSLPHYFQSHLAAGLSFVVQLFINGAEIFEGYIAIENSQCNYFDGSYQTPDLTILTDSAVWLDILKGRHTAQKAFMIGQLKVRGNFVLLSKYEQLFKKME